MAFMWVPAPIHSLFTIGTRVGVTVTTTSAPLTVSLMLLTALTLSPSFLDISSAYFSLEALIISVTLTSSIFFKTSFKAINWVLACAPAPTRPTTLESFLARYLAATPPAAPVLMLVTLVPPMIARGAPFFGFTKMMVAITVGRPYFFGFSGWTLTTLTAETSSCSRYEGMVLKSPLYLP